MWDMGDRPITIREALPTLAISAMVGIGAGIALGAWSGWLSDGVAMTFILGGTIGAAAVVGMKISDVRRRNRP